MSNGTPTNTDRSDWAEVAVNAFAEHVGKNPGDLDTNIVDLLADIRHLCDWEGFDYTELDRMAYQHYLTEVDQERE